MAIRSMLKVHDEDTPAGKSKCITEAVSQANVVRAIAIANYNKDVAGAD